MSKNITSSGKASTAPFSGKAQAHTATSILSNASAFANKMLKVREDYERIESVSLRSAKEIYFK